MKTKWIIFAAGLALFYHQAGAQVKRSAASYSGIVLSVTEGSVNVNLRGKAVSQSEVIGNLAAALGLSAGNSFKKINETTDNQGMTHTGFQQYYQNVKVDNGQVVVHSKQGWITSVNGQVAPLGNLSVVPALSVSNAVAAAKRASLVTHYFTEYPAELVVAGTSYSKEKSYALAYKVRVDGRAADGKTVMENLFVDANTGRLLKTENLISHDDVTGTAQTMYSGTRSFTIDSTATGYRLRDAGHNIETYDASGMKPDTTGYYAQNKDFINNSTTWDMYRYFTGSTLSSVNNTLGADATPGNKIAFLLLNGTLATGVARTDTRLSAFDTVGDLPIVCKSFYSLLDSPATYSGYYETMSGANVTYTFNDISVGTHPWADGAGNSGSYTIGMSKSPATDAHWGMQKVLDFYKDVFNRNSFDGVGGKVRNYVGAALNTNAAAVPPPYSYMEFGLGDGVVMGPMVGLDIMGHEFTHLVATYNGQGGLAAVGESGALSESFADIMGTSIEFFTKGSQANWTMGEGVWLKAPGFTRSMADPKLTKCPDTYQGQYWINPDSFMFDAGGIHRNNGVQNKWFYLLCQGGSGINDKGNAYNVTAIGIEKARKIAYRNLMVYTTIGSQYIDAYNGSLNATLDLFGNDTTSQEYKSVKQAWYAVGIGSNPATAVNEIAVQDNDLKLFPNPATGRVTVSSALNETLQAQVINVVGIPVMNITVKKGLNPVDISGLAKGVYMIRYNTGAKGYTQKLSVL